FAAAYLRDEAGAARELDLGGPLKARELAGAVEDATSWRLREGGSVEELLAVGDGAIRYRAELERAGARVPPDDSPGHLVDGAVVCALGARARAAARLQDVVPDYRRRPDAELRDPPHPAAHHELREGARA